MILLWAALAMVFLLGLGFFSATEMGFYSLNRLRLRLRAGRPGDRLAHMLLDLTAHRERSILAVLLTQNVMNYLLTVATVALIIELTGVGGHRADIYAAIVLSPIVFVFGDVVPKNWFHSQANRFMYPAAPVVKASVTILRYTGILWIPQSITRLIARLTGQESGETWGGPRGEIAALLYETAATGTLTEEQARMVERVMNLASVRLGSIMIPREHAVTLPAEADRAAFERIVRKHNYSRLPVLAADGRTVIGVVNVYDVLADQTGGPISNWFRPAVTLPARATAPEALLELRQAREPIGIVVDPRRGFVGIVTLKDLVEEIFGELTAW